MWHDLRLTDRKIKMEDEWMDDSTIGFLLSTNLIIVTELLCSLSSWARLHSTLSTHSNANYVFQRAFDLRATARGKMMALLKPPVCLSCLKRVEVVQLSHLSSPLPFPYLVYLDSAQHTSEPRWTERNIDRNMHAINPWWRSRFHPFAPLPRHLSYLDWIYKNQQLSWALR